MSTVTPQTLLRLTANMPMKQININGVGYLQRYYAGNFRDGSDLWLHRFLSNDGDRHVHSHPFEFQSVMLCGGYTEEFITTDGSKDHRITLPNASSKLPEMLEEILFKLNSSLPPASSIISYLAHGSSQSLGVYDWHRIAAVNDDTWTAVIVKPQRLPKWFFKDDSGDLVDMSASPRDWWKNYKTRPDCDIAMDDNHV